ncbi:MAG: hypothetical protein IH983_10925 [Planctomycetes bacterium]|nr:hypothetical protein [Planctomycetota bacterium]
MTNNPGCLGQFSRRRRAAPRRGNTIVLVVGILVLLVIIATAYISRTHAGRVTAAATQRATLRDDNAQVIADSIASEIAEALFVRPLVPLPSSGLGPALTSAPRLPIPPDALRYGVDPNDADGNLQSDYPYNFAPYHVVPFTNWPDGPPGGPANPLWPTGPGNPGPVPGLPNLALAAEGNALGNPGFGDTRWLADIEPLRWDTNDDGILDAFSHWRHMSNIARPGNGWRIVGDISDVESLLVTDLSIPAEQQLAIRSNAFHPVTGLPSLRSIGIDNFSDRWRNWYSPPSVVGAGYVNAYTSPAQIPPNFLDLKDLDGDGQRHNWDISGVPQERPESEYIPGTARWNALRVLADADGDGFTDSFWFLAPTMIERGIRQVVAVRIIDNSAMLNANVATRFVRADPNLNTPGFKTHGQTPADLQIVGDITDTQYTGGLQVGIFDNPANHEITPDPSFFGGTTIGYNPEMWAEAVTPIANPERSLNYLTEIGVQDQAVPASPNLNFPDQLTTQAERLLYWRAAGLRPFGASAGLTPFTLADEVELRMFQGQNYPWIASRFERAVQRNMLNGQGLDQFLHANYAREESTEYLAQLGNRELLFDSRRKLTLFNGARNDLMPPWLWWRWDQLPPGAAADYKTNQGLRKLDLREQGAGAVPPSGVLTFRERLAPTLLLALIDGDETGGDSYFGPYTGDPARLKKARLAAAGLAANIREYRDEDSDVSLADAEPLPELTTATLANDIRMLGMEKQPFLVEALIAHVYELVEAQVDHPTQEIEAGDHILCNDPPTAGAVVVVQIANPFDRVLDLNGYRLRVFFDEISGVGEVDLTPYGTMEPGSAKTFYAIEDDLGGEDLDGEWIQLLAIPPDSVDVSGTWSTTPSDYAAIDEERAVEILRLIPPIDAGPDVPVVVDRIDIKAPAAQEDYEFGEEVEGMRASLPSGSCVEILDWVNVENYGSDTHWVQWVQVTRAWDVDFNGIAGFQADEVNPRYVFSIRNVDTTDADGNAGTDVIPGSNPATFDSTDKNYTADDDLDFAMQMLQKDGDFEQVGELLNVWLFGHELEFVGGSYDNTEQTFSEFMFEEIEKGYEHDDDAVGVNRLRVRPIETAEAVMGPKGTPGPVLSPVIGQGDAMDLSDPLHAVPALPAGLRVLDAFVCDGRGVNSGSTFLNANGFSGKTTPGLININTAPVEVMRALPHMTRMVHEENSPSDNPYVRIPEAIVQYRERFNGLPPTNQNTTGIPYGADYSDRPGSLRPERGLASIGELMLLSKEANFTTATPLEPNENWLVAFAGLGPFTDPATGVVSTQISTDVNNPEVGGVTQPDNVATDVEEQNLLFAGISNLITTRSDMFTVYFKIRSFRQNPVTRKWDATDPESIVDDSRYVMLVDRSEVNRPTDKPKILYLEKLPK